MVAELTAGSGAGGGAPQTAQLTAGPGPGQTPDKTTGGSVSLANTASPGPRSDTPPDGQGI